MTRVIEVICEPFVNGGEESFIINLIKRIKGDITVDVYAPFGFDNEQYRFVIEESGGKVLTENPVLHPYRLRLKLTLGIVRIMKQNEYAVIHIHSSRLSTMVLAAIGAGLCHIKTIIVHSHSSDVSESAQRKIAKLLLTPFILTCPTDYAACSKAAAECRFPKTVADKKAIIIKNGIDLNTFRINEEKRQEYRNKLGYNNGDLVIGHVGRFCEEKNHGFIVDIFLELYKKDSRYKLLLLGDGSLKESVQSKVEKLGLSDSVMFTGNVVNVQDYMQAIDLFILPSLFEGLPITGVEAQACGLPCVFSTGVPEEAKLTENVERVSLEDKQRWIDTIENMIQLPRMDNTETIRKEGYDINETVNQIERIYLSR